MTFRSFCLALGVLATASSYCVGSDFSKFLHQLFDEHAGRQPSGVEMNYQANLMRSQGPLESYVSLFSSDDYFIRRAHRNYEVYVQNLYRTFLLRDARPDEIRYWVNQFAQPGVNRQSVLRSFLQSYHVTQLPSFPAECRPTPYRVPTSLPEIASELVAQVSMFNQTFAREVGGARYGREVLTQTARLLTVAAQYRGVVQSRSTNAEQLSIATNNLQQALQSVESEFYRVPGVSMVSRENLGHISQLVSAARLASQAPSGSGGGWGLSGDRGGVYRQLETLRDQVQSYAHGLQHYRSGPDYDRLSRNVQSLLVQVDALSLMLRQGQSNSRLRRTVGSALTQADAISRDIDRVDLTIQRGWWTIQQGLERVAQNLGVSNAWNSVSQPVVLGNPVWQQFGSQPRTSVGIPSRNRNVVDLADQTLEKIDGTLQALSPLAGRSTDAARLRASVLELRHEVQVLRQTAFSGSYGSQLNAATDRTMEQYKETSKSYAQAVGRDATLNSPTFYQIGELIQRLRYAAYGVTQ